MKTVISAVIAVALWGEGVMDSMSKQKREQMDAVYNAFGIEGPKPLFKAGDIPTWPGVVTSQMEPEREPSGDDVLRSIHVARELLAELDEVLVHVGTVDGVAYFWPKRMVDEMDALRSPRMWPYRSARPEADPVN